MAGKRAVRPELGQGVKNESFVMNGVFLQRPNEHEQRTSRVVFGGRLAAVVAKGGREWGIVSQGGEEVEEGEPALNTNPNRYSLHAEHDVCRKLPIVDEMPPPSFSLIDTVHWVSDANGNMHFETRRFLGWDSSPTSNFCNFRLCGDKLRECIAPCSSFCVCLALVLHSFPDMHEKEARLERIGCICRCYAITEPGRSMQINAKIRPPSRPTNFLYNVCLVVCASLSSRVVVQSATKWHVVLARKTGDRVSAKTRKPNLTLAN